MSEKYYGVKESDWIQHRAMLQWDKSIQDKAESFLLSCMPKDLDKDAANRNISIMRSEMRLNTHDYNQFDLCEVRRGEFRWLMEDVPKERIFAIYYEDQPMTMEELEKELDKNDPGMLSDEDRRKIRECG